MSDWTGAQIDGLVEMDRDRAIEESQQPKRKSKLKLSERDIERTCTDFLALDGWRYLKTDPVSRREWGKGFGEKGMADCLYIRYEAYGVMKAIGSKSFAAMAEVMWIEWKGPKGALSGHQAYWHGAERKRGALTLIAGQDFPPSIDGFMEWYRNSGLMRKKL